ncbi:MAG: hypothetical protein FJX76_23270 [Armatimonadetes bacterium]|nr:hypothetical protein [Armatimonadota bacterium]
MKTNAFLDNLRATRATTRREAPAIESLIRHASAATTGAEAPVPAVRILGTLRTNLYRATAEMEAWQRQGRLIRERRAALRIRLGYRECLSLLDSLEKAMYLRNQTALAQASDRLRRVAAALLTRYEAAHASLPRAYGRVYQACQDVVRGGISVDQWLAPLQALHEDVVRASRSLRKQRANRLHNGLADTLQAIATLRLYARDRDPRHLSDGWQRLVSAAVVMQKAA